MFTNRLRENKYFKRVMISLIVFIVTFSGIKIIGNYKSGEGKTALFFIPHQDDEVLSFAVDITNQLDKGYDVHIILMTDGSASNYKNILNREIQCGLLAYSNNPTEEGYELNNIKVNGFDEETFIKYRNAEFLSAVIDLGVKKQNIHILEKPEKDRHLTKDNSIKIMKKFLSMFPDAEINTFYYDSISGKRHKDHVVLGETAKELYDNGSIKTVKYYLEPYSYQNFKAERPKIGISTHKPNRKQKDRIVKALKEYCIWDPKNGKFAIGYYSMQNAFENSINKPVSYIISN